MVIESAALELWASFKYNLDIHKYDLGLCTYPAVTEVSA